MTQDTAVLDAARRAEARVIMEQYFDAMAQLGFSRQQAAELLREEES